jgi:hypothetical protein
MRGLEDALARFARRDELRERSTVTRRSPSVSPVVDEVAEALRAVVARNPGVFATVVVQEAETAWSVWIGEWDGTLHTRVTTLDPDPPAPSSASSPAPSPASPPASPAVGSPAVAPVAAQEPAIPLPRRRPMSPANRAAAALPAGPDPAPIADMLKPRGAASTDPLANADTPPMGIRPPLADAASAGRSTLADPGALLPTRSTLTDPTMPLPSRSALADPAAPLPKRFPDTGIPLPRRRPSYPSGVPLDQGLAPADTTPPASQAALATSVPAQRSPAESGPPVDAQVPVAQAPGAEAPPVPLAAAAPAQLPAEPEDTTWPPHYHPSLRVERASHRAESQPAPAGATPGLPVPTIPAPPLAAAQRVSGPAMNDRVAGRIAEMLRREAKRDKHDNRGLTS